MKSKIPVKKNKKQKHAKRGCLCQENMIQSKVCIKTKIVIPSLGLCLIYKIFKKNY